jgi:hypothetical protein
MSDMQQQQSDQDVPVTITLKVQEWNAVLNILAEGPFRIVAPLNRTSAEITPRYSQCKAAKW